MLLTSAAAAVVALGGTTALADAVAGPALPDGAAKAPAVRVFWTDPEKVLPFSPRHVATELERALGDMGIRLSWSTVTPATVSGPSDFRVVLLSTDRRQDGRRMRACTDSRGIKGRSICGRERFEC